ncbi:TIGR02147 family protein [Chitinispirillales bacterium ANBcel5]|uniref:TIGR02147 family protein n=1 Tax=Cellulosispirillum alkaliphilum TaxID=3039283 RepID=UPI002A4F8F21|nr:TIGR02147 family protein [Chitinispirillales bacterium ANBcel5]
MPEIYNYTNYKDYLKDFFKEQKIKSPIFSFRYVKQRIGIDPGNLAKILHKERHLATRFIPGFIKLCKLRGKRAEYFEIMVLLGRAKNAQDQAIYLEKLFSIKKITSHRIEEYQYEYYRKWYYSAVRALLDFYYFTDDYEALGEKLSPPITAREAKSAVELLENLELIEKNEDGAYKVTEKIVTTGETWHSAAITNFQKEVISLGAQALNQHKKEHRDVSTITMSINNEDIHKLSKVIHECRQSILSIIDKSEPSNSVYQLNIQLIPLTKIKGSGKSL